MKRTALALTLVMVLLFVFHGILIQPVESQSAETIIIKADGSVEGTDKIRRDGDTYVFTGSISGSIVVERDNIVLDGAGYVLQTSSDWGVGVDIRDRNNVAVKNLTIKGALGRCGILLINAINCKISQNNIIDNLNGIEMTGTSSRNTITENRIQNNSAGMEIYSVKPGYDNVISNNEVTNNSFGMQIKDFLNTDVSGNKITSNTYGLGLGLGSGSIARNNVMDNNTYGFRAFNVQRERGLDTPIVNVDVDDSNTVNGKPIIYWVNQHGKTVPAGVCYVALIDCTGITVKNLDLGGNLEGVFLGSTTNSTITNNRLSKCLFGVNLDASSNNTISGNIITGNENGIHLRWSSLNNLIQGNDITANTATGVYMADSSENKIIGNNIANSDRGIYTEYCGTNIVHHNNFVNNTKQWDDIGFTPWPIPLPISISVWDDGQEGNYWSDYNGTDADGDGIGDTPYIVGKNNTDRYPLMNPVTIPEFPEEYGPRTPDAEPFPATLVIASVVVVAVVGLGLLVYLKKYYKGGKL
jgi:parallel beta-helix repeat protein